MQARRRATTRTLAEENSSRAARRNRLIKTTDVHELIREGAIIRPAESFSSSFLSWQGCEGVDCRPTHTTRESLGGAVGATWTDVIKAARRQYHRMPHTPHADIIWRPQTVSYEVGATSWELAASQAF